MAISPAELHDLLTDEKIQADKLEHLIDEFLKSAAATQGFRAGYRYFPHPWPNFRILEEITERYEAIGWKIDYDTNAKSILFKADEEKGKS